MDNIFSSEHDWDGAKVLLLSALYTFLLNHAPALPAVPGFYIFYDGVSVNAAPSQHALNLTIL